MINLEIPVIEIGTKEIEFQKFCKGEQDLVLFQADHPDHRDIAYVLIHGTTSGDVVAGGYHLTTFQLLEWFTKKEMHKRKDKPDIKELVTISCHGGLQKSHTIDGVTISSLHESPEEILIQPCMTLDDQLILDVKIPE